MPYKDPQKRREYDAKRNKEDRNKRDNKLKSIYNKQYNLARIFTATQIENAKSAAARRHLRRKLRVFEYYSNGTMICNCCGENIIEFLSIDHINGGGRKHRAEVGKNLYRWIIRNNFPPGFQVLCNNCNMAKGIYGICPHKNPLSRL